MRTLFPRASWIAAARSALAVLLVGLASAAMAQVPAVDWKAERAEILRHYRALVQIDTSNPPGNETLVTNYLKGVFEAAGIPVKTFALEPARANLVARIKGNGSKRPVLIMAHTDVVGVQREKWPVDPFGAVAKDGYIWGRGTKDDKDKLTANLITMLLAKRLDVPLDRDLIFLAEAGEEGTTTVGIDFMVKEHFDDIDAEFAITEGGGATLEDGRVTVVNIQTTEKVPRGARLVASGTSGHGSVPRVDNPLVHLSAAIAKVGAWENPDSAERHHAALFRKTGWHQPARQGRAISRSPRPAARPSGPALFRGERAAALFHAPHIHRADHSQRRIPDERHPVGSGSDIGHPRLAG